jgi:hypothetical protein
MRNCLMLGSLGTAIALLGGTQEPIQVEIENSLFTMHRVFALRSEPDFRAEVKSFGSVFASEALIDLGNAYPNQSITASWTDCVLDRSQGVLMRVNRYGKGEWLRTVTWAESNIIYTGNGDFLADRRSRRVPSEAEWNALMRLTTNSHVVTQGQAFAGIRARANRQLSASDVDADGLRQVTGAKLRFDPAWIGEDAPYDRFRAQPEYRQWQQQTKARLHRWKQRRESRRTNAR